MRGKGKILKMSERETERKKREKRGFLQFSSPSCSVDGRWRHRAVGAGGTLRLGQTAVKRRRELRRRKTRTKRRVSLGNDTGGGGGCERDILSVSSFSYLKLTGKHRSNSGGNKNKRKRNVRTEIQLSSPTQHSSL